MNLNKSTKDNPFAFFEYLYNTTSLTKLEEDFLLTNDGFLLDLGSNEDIRNVVQESVIQHADMEIEYFKWTFKDRLKSILNNELNLSLNFLEQRLNTLNDNESNKFVLNKFKDKIQKCICYVEENPKIVYHLIHLENLIIIRNFINKKFQADNSSFKSDVIEEDNPFSSLDNYNIFIYLDEWFKLKSLSKFSYIFDFMKDNIDPSLNERLYFEFIMKIKKIKMTPRAQPTATSDKNKICIKNLYADYMKGI